MYLHNLEGLRKWTEEWKQVDTQEVTLNDN